MRILFLSRWYPYPADNGSKIRVFNLIKELARSHEITLISFAAAPVSPEDTAAMRAYCAEVHSVVYKPFQPKSTKSMAGFLSRKPRSLVDCYSEEFQQLVNTAVQQTQYDLVIASQIEMALYTTALTHIPKILEEIEISIFYDKFVKEQRPLKRLRHRLTWEKWAGFLADTLRTYDGCTVVSDPEVAPIHRALPGYEPIAVIPNGADIARFTGDFGAPQPNTLVYTGALTYHVNFDAMQFFLRDIFPLIQQAVPDVKLYIAGRLDGVPVDQLPKNDAVIYTGHLSDIRPRVAQSWISIVPERIGGGTRIKVPEAMALGSPVVATTRGATGLKVTPGHDILVADQPQEFAASVIRLLKDAELRATLSRNGRATVETHYDWSKIGIQLDHFIQTIVTR